MNISYVTTYDAKDIHKWSGLGYYIAEALEGQHAHIDYAGNLETPVSQYLRLKKRVYNKLGKNFLFDRVPSLIKSSAAKADIQIKPGTDIIFAPSTLPICMMQAKQPKVFYTDATFAGMVNFYPYLTNLSAETIRNGNMLEQAAFDNCELAIYSSDWAAQTAIENYKVKDDKVKVVPFGANIECHRNTYDIEQIISAKDKKICHLLFLGVEWDRKGGDMALQTAKLLNQNGLPTTLHIAGIKDLPLLNVPDYVKSYGFISKASPEGENLLNTLFEKSHFLILPSKADCTPVVYAEANSFGLPCISTNVGGIATIIKDDINGKTFTLNDGAEKYAQYIEGNFASYPAYAELCRSSFNEYKTRLNWETTGKTLMQLLKAL